MARVHPITEHKQQSFIASRIHLVEAGLAEAAAEGRVAGAGQRQRPLCPVPLELSSLSINIYRKTREDGDRRGRNRKRDF